MCWYVEVVLLVLLQRFRFAPTGDAIAWNSAPVQYPTVGKVSEEPALPLKVELLNPCRVRYVLPYRSFT